MSTKLVRGVVEDGRFDPVVWNGLVAAGFPVGRCDCGLAVFGERFVAGRGLTFAEMTCGAGHMSARPVRDLVPA